MANLFQPSITRIIDSSVRIVSGAKMYFYLTGTGTLASIYTDSGGVIAATNPVVADSAGTFAPVFLDPAITYRVRFTDAAGILLRSDLDPVPGSDPAIATAVANAAAAATAAGAVQVALAAAQVSLVTQAAAGTGIYPNAAATNVPRGLTQAGVGAITPGATGTNGTFALAWTGGNFSTNPSGTFTVAGNVLTAVTITGPGLYIGASPSVPTPSFAASAGLAGAGVALTAQFLVATGVAYWVQSADNTQLLRYSNSSGTPATVSGVGPYPLNVAALTTLASHYANDSTNVDVPGGSVGDRGAKYWSTVAAAAAASVGSLPNGTMQRWVDLGGTASATTLAALRVLENRLRVFDLSKGDVVTIGTLAGTGTTSPRIPFYLQPNCGGAYPITGTLASFTEANGLVLSGTTGLDTGITPQSAGLNQYDMGLFGYFASNTTTDAGYAIGGSGNGWGFTPFAGTTSFASANLITYDFYGRVIGDPAVDRIDGTVGNRTYVATGAMGGVRTKSGMGYIMRDHVSLQGGTFSTYPEDASATYPTSETIVIRANIVPLYAYWITRGMPEARAAMLSQIIEEFQIAIGRGASKAAL